MSCFTGKIAKITAIFCLTVSIVLTISLWIPYAVRLNRARETSCFIIDHRIEQRTCLIESSERITCFDGFVRVNYTVEDTEDELFEEEILVQNDVNLNNLESILNDTYAIGMSLQCFYISGDPSNVSFDQSNLVVFIVFGAIFSTCVVVMGCVIIGLFWKIILNKYIKPTFC